MPLLILFLTGCALDTSIPGAEVRVNICSLEPEDEFQSGEGSINNPFVICTTEQFVKIQDDPSLWDKSFLLAADIDLSNETNLIPIGSYNVASPGSAVGFSGRLDGQGFTISGVSLAAPTSDDAVGLFGYTNGATISNLKVSNFDIKASQHGALIAGTSLNSNFYNIELAGSLGPREGETDGIILGGLIGYGSVDDPSQTFAIENIQADINLSGNDRVGAIIGVIEINEDDIRLNIKNMSSQSNFTQSETGNTIGGMAGMLILRSLGGEFEISNLHHQGDLNFTEGGGSWCGGLVGQLYLDADQLQATIQNLSFSGELNSIADFNLGGSIGGIVGLVSYNNSDNSSVAMSQLAVNASLSVLPNAIAHNRCWGGLFGFVRSTSSSTSDMTISDSYFLGEFSSPNANNFNRTGGVFGCLKGGGTGSANYVVQRVYVNFTESLTPTLSDALAIVGYEESAPTTTYEDVFFTAPSSYVGGSGEGESTNSAEVNELNSTQAKQQSSYSDWDFDSVWQIQEGQNPPTLRSTPTN